MGVGQLLLLAWVVSENGAGGTGILLPGTPELQSRERRLAEGIPLDPATLDGLAAAARSVGLPGLNLP